MPLASRLCGASVFEKFAQKIRGGWRWARSVVAIIVSAIIASQHISSDVAYNPNGVGKSQGLIRIVVFGIAMDDAFREANCQCQASVPALKIFDGFPDAVESLEERCCRCAVVVLVGHCCYFSLHAEKTPRHHAKHGARRTCTQMCSDVSSSSLAFCRAPPRCAPRALARYTRTMSACQP